jgi:dTDP-4-dehydrorhamnose reductase
MRVLVLGGTGQLGRGFVTCFNDRSGDNFGGARAYGITDVNVLPRNVDVSDSRALRSHLVEYRPDWIINAAAYTQVDAAEQDPYPAITTNAGGAANVALVAKELEAKLIYFSTESVFDGRATFPYTETDVCNPLSVYSISKRAGEEFTQEICESSYVIRTSWLYGDSRTSNFPARLLSNLSASDGPVPVVSDLVGNPTPVTLLVQATLAIMQSPPDVGLYHVCSGGSATKNEWAQAIARSRGYSQRRIVPANSSDFPTPARRSQNVVLSCEKFLSTGLLPLPHWNSFYSSTETTHAN